MKYSDLSGKFDGDRNQHNIMTIVGNGFDINMLTKHGYELPNGQKMTTSYPLFYSYYKRNCLDDDNILIQAMEKARSNQESNWADFENLIPKAIETEINTQVTAEDSEEVREEKEDKILNKAAKDLRKLQTAFATFLSKYVDVKVENAVGKDSEENKLAIGSLSSFLSDLSEDNYNNFVFPSYIEYYDIFNFLFVNLNFTNLLDNYIYLDKDQFDPHRYKTVDRNFIFRPNPNDYPNCHRYKTQFINDKTIYNSYVHVSDVHPHGNQHIARSLLFGANAEQLLSHKKSSRFNKEYWVQYPKYYQDLIDDTRLFIVYGSSLDNTDKWWWIHILSKLAEKSYDLHFKVKSKESDSKHVDDINVQESINSELLIYWYDPDGQHPFSVDEFIDKFAIQLDPQTGNAIKIHPKSKEKFEVDPETRKAFGIDPVTGNTIRTDTYGRKIEFDLQTGDNVTKVEKETDFQIGDTIPIDPKIKEEIKRRIFVIPFKDPNDLEFLSFKPKDYSKK